MTAATRRSVMTLFSDPLCPDSHRIRFMLAEKGITPEIEDVVPGKEPEDLLSLNPYGSLPTLVDRDVALYSPGVIIEYLDEQIGRASCRERVERWGGGGCGNEKKERAG